MRILVTFVVFFLLPATGGASSEFYTIRLPAKEYPQVNKEAIRQAVAKMIVKLTGNADLMFDAVVKKKLRTVGSEMLVSYRNLRGGYVEQLELRLNKDRILRLLAALQLKVWPLPRPETIVWLAVENNQKRRGLVSEAALPPGWKNDIAHLRNERGMRYFLPLMNLSERQAIQISQFWLAHDETLINLSRSYRSDQVLIIAARQSAIGWELLWRLYTADGALQDNSLVLSDELQRGVRDVMLRAIDLTWLRERAILEQSKQFYLSIANVHDLDAYQQVKRNIFGSRWLKKASLLSVKDGELRYQLETYGRGLQYLLELHLRPGLTWAQKQQELRLLDKASPAINMAYKHVAGTAGN